MPKQSRGFWVCIHCEKAFDSYEAASYHEQIQECRSAAASAQVDYRRGMAPLSAEERRQQEALAASGSYDVKQQPPSSLRRQHRGIYRFWVRKSPVTYPPPMLLLVGRRSYLRSQICTCFGSSHHP
jgi:hypothetical protein